MRRQTAKNPPSYTQQPPRSAAADISYGMRVNVTHAFQTESPQLT